MSDMLAGLTHGMQELETEEETVGPHPCRRRQPCCRRHQPTRLPTASQPASASYYAAVKLGGWFKDDIVTPNYRRYDGTPYRQPRQLHAVHLGYHAGCVEFRHNREATARWMHRGRLHDV